MATKLYLGADLHCYYQRNIDWPMVAQTDLKFFYVQISRGNAPLVRVVDGVTYTPGSQIAGVRSIDRMLGGYHFCTVDSSPEQQAAVFAGQLRMYCALDIPPMFDVESTGGFDGSAPAAHEFIVRFYNAMRRLGFPVMGVYSNAYFLSQVDADPVVLNKEGLLVWAADYAANSDGTPAPLRYYTGPVDIRQFSNKGNVAGIGPGFVDLNQSDMGFMRFYGMW